MKKFISMVMAAAMVVSLVPATAFAKGEVTATAKVVDAVDFQKPASGTKIVIDKKNAPEAQLTITDATYKVTDPEKSKMDVTFTLDGAELTSLKDNALLKLIRVENENGRKVSNLKDNNDAVPASWDGTPNSAGEYVYNVALDKAVKMPAFADKAAVSVADQAKALKADGWEFTGDVYDAATDSFTNGFASKAGEADKDLTQLAVIPAVSAATQQNAWLADNNYFAVDGWVIGDVVFTDASAATNDSRIRIEVKEADDEYVTYTFTGFFKEDDVVIFDLASELTGTSEGHTATVSVDSKMVEAEDMVYATIAAKALDVTVSGKPVEVAQEEKVELKKITIESVVGNFEASDEIKVKVSKGFEFVKSSLPADAFDVEEDSFKVTGYTGDTIELAAGIEIEAVSAKAGDVATLTVSCKNFAADSDEAAIVIEDVVIMEVDEDADVPTFYNGVNAADYGLTSDDNHKSLEVTIKETTNEAWDTVKAFTLSLPEGVYVTDVTGLGIENSDKEIDLAEVFKDAYQKGDFEGFEFGRRTFDFKDDTKKGEIKFTLTLVAEPTFTGDVTLTLEGDAFDTQEVVIANFVAPVAVEAAQNDMIIDYKATVVPTAVVLKEAEEGLWKENNATFALNVERIDVEDADVTVDDESGMEIKVKDDTTFKVTEESDDAAAVVTMDNVALYMQRMIPAGTYALKLNTSMYDAFLAEGIYAADAKTKTVADVLNKDLEDFNTYTVKEGFVNVITSGRDKDDASFTTKVVVPVGENYLIANEKQVALDVPAYINANGYTMLPVRAVSVALGIDTHNVLWDQTTKTVTILYGQRIITMTVGQKVVNVNGSAIPATAAVEVVNGRAFLGMRDMATALGVTDITWDPATQTATLNGNR